MQKRQAIAAITAIGCTLIGVAVPSASAQAPYPSQTLKLIVPWPAGGSSDAIARLMAQQLGERLKQNVIVDNRPGASGNIGTQAASKAAPDGHTLLLSSGPFSINPSLMGKLPFDTERDFTPVAKFAESASALVVHPSTPAQTMQDFVKLARDAKTPVSIATPGNGSAQHLAMALLSQKANLNLNHVPYKGGAPALNDVMAGQVPAMMGGITELAPRVVDGRLRALAVTTASRSSVLPNVPTLMELGLADSGTGGWAGLHVPAGTPAQIVDRLNQEVNAILANPEIRAKLATAGWDVKTGTPAEFGDFVRQQMARWAQAVKISGATVD